MSTENISVNSEEYDDPNLLKSPTFTTENVDHPDSPEYNDYDNTFFDEIAPAYPRLLNSNTDLSNISENLAIQYLDEACNTGSITGSEMAMYKNKFLTLCTLLERGRENEFKLFQLSKKWTLNIEREHILLAKTDEYPDDSNTEVSKARQVLLTSQNDLMSLDIKNTTIEYQISRLTEERKMLENELKRLPGIKDKEIFSKLESSVDEINTELTNYLSEKKTLTELLKDTKEQVKMTTEENDVVLNTINTQKSKLVDANSLPTHQMKAFDKLRKEKQEQEEILQNLKEECDLLSKSKNEINCELSKEEEEIETVKKEYNKIQNQFIIVEGQLDGVNKLIKQSQGQEAELKQDRATIQFDLNSFLMEKKQVYFDLQQQTKNKDKLIKQLKSEQLQLRKNEESLNLINQEWENINIEYNTYPKSNNDVKESINKRIQDISHRKQLFVTQETLTEAEKAKEISVIQLNERLEFDKKDNKVSLDELHRLAQIKYDEREQKAKDFNGIKKKEDTLLEDLKEKKLLIEASKKKILDTQLKLNESAKMYSVMQNERNKFANYINSARQKCSEMREKIRICNNEIEILKTQLYNKEELMQKQRSKFVQVISMRDSLKSEICKQISVLSKQKEKRDQLQLNMQRLNQLCNQGEETLMRLRVRNDTALRNRNDRALQLIERNEEVCILQEKYNIKEDVLKIAEQEIQIRDEENTFFYQNISELKREMSLLKQQEVTQSIVERDILNLQIQISLCQDRHIELEKQVENPEGPNRTRELKGMDPTTISLQLKLEDLHFKLNEKDEFLIEKDLLYKAVNKLVLNLKSKQCEFKTDTLDVANTLNSFKFRMGHIIKKLKAKSAELTMNMSEVLKLQKNTKENQTFLNDVYKKIENGEDIESFNFNRAKYMKTLSDFSIQQFQLTNGLYTTAEPRSNAYIPDNESDLPIPHPYGAQAPFKPSEAGSSMRHIKKQKLKPIEI